MEVLETLEKVYKDDVLFVANKSKKTNYRDDSDNIFFDSGITLQVSPQLPTLVRQVKPSKNPQEAAQELKELKVEQRLYKILKFFDRYAFVDLANFKVIQNLLIDYFSCSYSLSDSIRRLKEEVDKHSKDHSGHGKLYINTIVKNNSLRLTLTRSKAKNTSQYVSFTLDEDQHSELFVYTTQIKENKKKSELIRNCMLKNRSFKQNQESIKFDAQIWKSFNVSGLYRKNYLKTLDCIERNRLNLSDFINEINKKCFSNIFDKNFIENIKIKTDNKHVLCLEFNNNKEQTIISKLTRDAASLSVVESI